MSFFRSTKTYGQSSPTTPYERAQQEWDNRIGSARVQAFHWRLVAILSLLSTIALTAGLVRVTVRKDVKVYVVEVDELGRPGRISLLDQRYQPAAAEAGYFVRQLVDLVRRRSLDPVVVRENWKTAYAYLAGDAVNTMTAYASSDPPVRTVEGRLLTRTVAISNVLQKSDRTYQVRWVETNFVGGVPQPQDQYTGIFQIENIPPKDESEVFRNPLGLYVVNFNWSKEFTGPVAMEHSQDPAPPATQNQEHADETNP